MDSSVQNGFTPFPEPGEARKRSRQYGGLLWIRVPEILVFIRQAAKEKERGTAKPFSALFYSLTE
jgi:hypothetical protein